MKYMISSISDVVTEEGGDNWERVMYVDRTAPLARESGLGIEIAEFCISDNMELKFDEVLPHVETLVSAAKYKTLHAPYNELYPMAIEPLSKM